MCDALHAQIDTRRGTTAKTVYVRQAGNNEAMDRLRWPRFGVAIGSEQGVTAQAVREYGKPETTKLWTDCDAESLLTQCCQ
jgi:hypothetical protein